MCEVFDRIYYSNPITGRILNCNFVPLLLLSKLFASMLALFLQNMIQTFLSGK